MSLPSQLFKQPSVGNRLRGGWFVGPEEYEQMGYTLGLPPGFYLPFNKDVQDLVQKLKGMNGVILPSYTNLTQENADKRKVFVTNLPKDLDVEEFPNMVIKSLGKLGQMSDNPILNFDLHQNRDSGILEFRTPKDAEAVVNQRSIIVNGIQVSFQVYNNPYGDDSSEHEKFGTRSDFSDSIIVEFEEPAPRPDVIALFIRQVADVKRVNIPEGFNHALVELSDPSKADHVVYMLHDSEFQSYHFKVSRCFCHDKSGPKLLPIRTQRLNRVNAGPSTRHSIVSPLLRGDPCVGDILNCDVPTTVTIAPETEELSKPQYHKLLIYNIVPTMVLYDSELNSDYVKSITNEINKFAKFETLKIHEIPGTHLPADYAVVEIEFSSVDDAHRVQMNLAGRRYNGRIVITQLAD